MVGMADEALARPPIPDRHLQRSHHRLGAQVIRYGPPNDAAAEHVEHHYQIEEPSPVGTYVISAIHSWSDALAVNARRTRSGASSATVLRCVVWKARRRWQPASPGRRISRTIRSASSSRWACTRCASRSGLLVLCLLMGHHGHRNHRVSPYLFVGTHHATLQNHAIIVNNHSTLLRSRVSMISVRQDRCRSGLGQARWTFLQGRISRRAD